MKHATRIDARTIKTKQRIQETLRMMVMDHTYSQITVSELARKADIHRKTFYLHYETIDSAFEELAKSVAEMIGKLASSHVDSILLGDYMPFLNAYEDFLTEDQKFHKRLFCEPSYRNLNLQIQNLSCDALLDTIEKASQDISDIDRMKISFIAYGLNGIRRHEYLTQEAHATRASTALLSKIANACWNSDT